MDNVPLEAGMNPSPLIISGWTAVESLWAAVPQADSPAAEGEPAHDNFPINPQQRYYHGILSARESGVAALHLQSPRPLRVYIGGVLVLDEPLSWRSFQREVRAAVVLPVSGGKIPFWIEFGQRPRHPESVDRHSPSRNRQHTLSEIERIRPDTLSLAGTVTTGGKVPELAASFRFLPAQFVKDGVTYQHVLTRPILGLTSGPPTTNKDPGTADHAIPSLRLASTVAPFDAIEGTSENDRVGGLRRFFVPVASPSDRPAPLREIGAPEVRPEPVTEVARFLALTLRGETDAGIVLTLPAYESLGRLAPRREWTAEAQPMEWEPSALAQLPELVLPPSLAHLGPLYYATWEMLRNRVKVPLPESGLPGPYISTGPGFPHHQFVWDTSFTAIAARYGHTHLPVASSLDLLYSRLFDGGYLHREHDTRDGSPALYEPDFSPNPPLLSVAEWNFAAVTGDTERLARIYPALCEIHTWLRVNRRLPNGTYWTTGLANGLDNSPSLGDGYPDLTAQMAHDAETLAHIAIVLGKQDDSTAWLAERQEIGDALNRHLWDDNQGIYSTSLAGGGHNPNKVVTAFWPLWAGVVPSDRAERLAQHLRDPLSFWRHNPLPSLAADSPFFVPGGDYWRGSVWAPTSYAAICGFARAGYRDIAREATRRFLQVLYDVWSDTGKLWENYSSESPSRRGSTSQPDYCWTALGPIALLLEITLGFEVDAISRTLRWHVPPFAQGEGTIGVRRLQIGTAEVSAVRNSDGSLSIETTADVILELKGSGNDRTLHLSPGRLEVPPPDTRP